MFGSGDSKIFYKYSIMFIIINAVFMYFESYYFALVPFVAAVFFLSLFHLDKILLVTVCAVPLSVPLRDVYPGLPIDFYLPTEPLLFGLLILFIFKILIEKKFDRKILLHPVSIAIIINLIWIFITSLTSTMPVVSIKYFLARLWFVVPFYFIASEIFKKQKNIKAFIILYASSFVIVIIYTISRHLSIGLFDEQAAHWVMSPFFNDHTSYGAMLAMFIPILIGLAVKSDYSQQKKLFIWGLVAIFFIAFYLSYSRAAWLSLFIAFIVYLIVIFRIKFRSLLITAATIAIIIISFSSQILIELNQNKQDSSGDIEEHIKSMSNIRTDASNLERLNRWNSAFRMFREKPIFGWGPGTYMFQYAGFQFSYEKTIISTNAGDMGNAHSEYIGPLAESGVLGPVSFLLILISSLYSGVRAYKNARKKEIKALAITAMLGLVTYFVHGLLNNFLDTDKASAPFWGFIAIIVAIDIYHNKLKTT